MKQKIKNVRILRIALMLVALSFWATACNNHNDSQPAPTQTKTDTGKDKGQTTETGDKGDQGKSQDQAQTPRDKDQASNTEVKPESPSELTPGQLKPVVPVPSLTAPVSIATLNRVLNPNDEVSGQFARMLAAPTPATERNERTKLINALFVRGSYTPSKIDEFYSLVGRLQEAGIYDDTYKNKVAVTESQIMDRIQRNARDRKITAGVFFAALGVANGVVAGTGAYNPEVASILKNELKSDWQAGKQQASEAWEGLKGMGRNLTDRQSRNAILDRITPSVYRPSAEDSVRTSLKELGLSDEEVASLKDFQVVEDRDIPPDVIWKRSSKEGLEYATLNRWDQHDLAENEKMLLFKQTRQVRGNEMRSQFISEPVSSDLADTIETRIAAPAAEAVAAEAPVEYMDLQTGQVTRTPWSWGRFKEMLSQTNENRIKPLFARFSTKRAAAVTAATFIPLEGVYLLGFSHGGDSAQTYDSVKMGKLSHEQGKEAAPQTPGPQAQLGK